MRCCMLPGVFTVHSLGSLGSSFTVSSLFPETLYPASHFSVKKFKCQNMVALSTPSPSPPFPRDCSPHTPLCAPGPSNITHVHNGGRVNVFLMETDHPVLFMASFEPICHHGWLAAQLNRLKSNECKESTPMFLLIAEVQ